MAKRLVLALIVSVFGTLPLRAEGYTVGNVNIALPLPEGQCPLPRSTEVQRELYKKVQASFRKAYLVVVGVPCDLVDDVSVSTMEPWSFWLAAGSENRIFKLPANYSPEVILAKASAGLRNLTIGELNSIAKDRLGDAGPMIDNQFVGIIESSPNTIYLGSFAVVEAKGSDKVVSASVGGMFFKDTMLLTFGVYEYVRGLPDYEKLLKRTKGVLEVVR